MSDTVVIAMSGGVDSSVCAQMMVEQGYNCVGMTMRLYKGKEAEAASCSTKSCCGSESVDDARLVAETLGIPYYAINFRQEFWDEVIEVFASNYFEGKTPSPCILCNEKLKFKSLFDKAKEIGASKVCTGHYAKVIFDEDTGRYQLLRGKDRSKDQSYFLFSMTQQMLAQTWFPLGDYTKDQIRKMAHQGNLVTANKRESQDICFIPDGNYAGFLERHFPKRLPKKGNIMHVDGTKLGEHEGVYQYTIGQRKGLVGGAKRPLYVVGIDSATQTVQVGHKEHTLAKSFEAERVNWISVNPKIGETIAAAVKIRSRSEEAVATITRTSETEVLVEFSLPQNAITPGQACVFYDKDKVLGGGWITRKGHEDPDR